MDQNCIGMLISNGSNIEELKKAQEIARQALQTVGEVFPRNGCAATLSALLQMSGVDIKMTLGAGKLVYLLGGSYNSRGWQHIPVGKQQAGDVGVCFDNCPPAGSDHVYLVLECIDSDRMMIADNQKPEKHQRSASGACGETQTEYFLRAS